MTKISSANSVNRFNRWRGCRGGTFFSLFCAEATATIAKVDESFILYFFVCTIRLLSSFCEESTEFPHYIRYELILSAIGWLNFLLMLNLLWEFSVGD